MMVVLKVHVCLKVYSPLSMLDFSKSFRNFPQSKESQSSKTKYVSIIKRIERRAIVQQSVTNLHSSNARAYFCELCCPQNSLLSGADTKMDKTKRLAKHFAQTISRETVILSWVHTTLQGKQVQKIPRIFNQTQKLELY